MVGGEPLTLDITPRDPMPESISVGRAWLRIVVNQRALSGASIMTQSGH
jgi:hypothetical protein